MILFVDVVLVDVVVLATVVNVVVNVDVVKYCGFTNFPGLV